jgi:lipopolysaccharide transport system ATP-binding protein
MAEDVVIRAEGLGKKYIIGHAAERERYVALRDVLARGAQKLWRKTRDMTRGRVIFAGDTLEEFWALRDVSFEVGRGEVLGVVGRNGAGKTTLLKILSRITEPSEGRVTIRGRVGSLLEVGTGFHPELTGRENIYLNGAILGMTRAEVRRKFDEIVAFAEVERFIDTPVKRYSSGMYVRLAFSVAAHLEPDILVVDEVLAVGDADFQQKCLGKMDDVSRREGRTVLFVSHNMSIISKLCPTAIWLDCGSSRLYGDTDTVVREYFSQGLNRDRVVRLDHLTRPFSGENRLRLISVEWRCDLPLRHGEPLTARIRFENQAPLANVAVAIGFCDISGNRILTYDTDLQDGYRPNLPRPGAYAVDVEIDALPLQPNTYMLDIGCRAGDTVSLDYIPSALQLEVLAGPKTPSFIAHHHPGVRLKSRWTWGFEDLVGSPPTLQKQTTTF